MHWDALLDTALDGALKAFNWGGLFGEHGECLVGALGPLIVGSAAAVAAEARGVLRRVRIEVKLLWDAGAVAAVARLRVAERPHVALRSATPPRGLSVPSGKLRQHSAAHDRMQMLGTSIRQNEVLGT